jgi:dCTP deaminase
MILSDTSIRRIGLWNFISPAEDILVNPASIDIRLGSTILEQAAGIDHWKPYDLKGRKTYELQPGQFVLVETHEQLLVPQGYAIDLRLKSSVARKGFDHSMAFWFDPGWKGIGTLEIRNVSHWVLVLEHMMRFAQIIIHELSEPTTKLYSGKYQGAKTVEAAKD